MNTKLGQKIQVRIQVMSFKTHFKILKDFNNSVSGRVILF
jgi:hypothetical protein